jgi:hypothetical protein
MSQGLDIDFLCTSNEFAGFEEVGDRLDFGLGANVGVGNGLSFGAGVVHTGPGFCALRLNDAFGVSVGIEGVAAVGSTLLPVACSIGVSIRSTFPTGIAITVLLSVLISRIANRYLVRLKITRPFTLSFDPVR